MQVIEEKIKDHIRRIHNETNRKSRKIAQESQNIHA